LRLIASMQMLAVMPYHFNHYAFIPFGLDIIKLIFKMYFDLN